MHELVFALEYEPNCNSVADTLAEHPDALIRSLSLHATEECLWRVDHATGTPDALVAIEDAFLDSDYYADCLATEDCNATQTMQVLDRTEDTLVLYSYWERTPLCSSIPHIARAHLGDGLLFDTRHESRHYTWRIIHSGEGDVSAFFNELGAAVGDCARMELLRTTATSTSTNDADSSATELSTEQEAALQAAVEHGYYESPREIDVGELAKHFDVPRSTLTYRLRRAEEYLAKQYVAREQAPVEPSTLL